MSHPIGTSVDRMEGAAKVTGAAVYAADPAPKGVTYAVFAPATIARGRVVSLDTAAAETAPGVVRIFTARNMPRLTPVPSPPSGQSVCPLQDDRIHYEGQPIALVVADSLSQAQHAASLVRATYESEPSNVDFRTALDTAKAAPGFSENDTLVGNLEKGLGEAAAVVEETYNTADRHHVPMEPSATLAEWRNGELFLRDATQWIWGVRAYAAAALGIPPDKVHVTSDYIGGGFGSKGYVWPHQAITSAAARELGRPVKLALTRANTFTAHGYQPASLQRVTVGANKDGALTAIRHHAFTPTSRGDGYVEYAAISSRRLYACPNIETRHRIVAVDRTTPTPMRAPHEGLANFGIESAIDELSYKLKIDPLEIRVRNYAEQDPTSHKPFSSKALRECYRAGAERFGWSKRNPEPRSMRQGRQAIGWGVATAMMETFRFPSKARVSVESGGTVLVEAGAQEIGTGLYTVVQQIVAEVMDVPMDRVRFHHGDTSLPETGGTFGSSATIGVGSAAHDAATRLKARLTELNGGQMPAPEQYDALLARHGVDRLTAESDWSSRDVVQRVGLAEKIRTLSAEGQWAPGPGSNFLGEDPRWSIHTWGAVFVEVRVDEDFPIPRLTRIVGVYSAGRIINPKMAASQMKGGIIWGVGQALLEDSAMDRTLGRYLSKNLAGYLVPVQADIPDVEVDFVEEVDPHASALGARGIGELGSTGVSAAIANAAYHATGVRVRDLPLRPEQFL